MNWPVFVTCISGALLAIGAVCWIVSIAACHLQEWDGDEDGPIPCLRCGVRQSAQLQRVLCPTCASRPR